MRRSPSEANCCQQHWIKWTRIRLEVEVSVLGSAYGCQDELKKRQLCLINTWWAVGRTLGVIGGAVKYRWIWEQVSVGEQRDCRSNSLWMTFVANLDTCYERHDRKRMFITASSWSYPIPSQTTGIAPPRCFQHHTLPHSRFSFPFEHMASTLTAIQPSSEAAGAFLFPYYFSGVNFKSHHDFQIPKPVSSQ